MWLWLLTLMGCTSDVGITPSDDVDPWVDHFVQHPTTSGADVLWLIDYSCSMNNDWDRVSVGMESMMNALPEHGWRLHIVPDNPEVADSIDFTPLEPGDDIDDVLDYLEDVGNSGTVGLEKLMDSVVAYMSNELAWLDPDDAILTVFVSDEDDSSDTTPDEFIRYMTYKRPLVSVASIVGLDEDDSCAFDPGFDYLDAADLSGGVVVDFCEEDWTDGAELAVQNIDPITELELTHEPKDDKVWVFYDRMLQPDTIYSYDVDANTVYFVTAPPAESVVEIAYLLDD